MTNLQLYCRNSRSGNSQDCTSSRQKQSEVPLSEYPPRGSTAHSSRSKRLRRVALRVLFSIQKATALLFTEMLCSRRPTIWPGSSWQRMRTVVRTTPGGSAVTRCSVAKAFASLVHWPPALLANRNKNLQKSAVVPAFTKGTSSTIDDSGGRES